jgi:hypothetical protein
LLGDGYRRDDLEEQQNLLLSRIQLAHEVVLPGAEDLLADDEDVRQTALKLPRRST